MALEELDKTRAELRSLGADLAVISSYANLTYVTGTEVPLPVGALHELTYAPWLAVISATGAGLVTNSTSSPATDHGFDLIPFDGFDSFNPTDPAGSYVAAIQAALKRVGARGGAGTIGIETRSLPFVAAEAIRAALPGWTIVDVEPALIRARWIKTAREIGLLRQASHLADVSHETLAQQCREAGRSEIAIYAEIERAIFTAAGRDIPLAGELVVGPRTTTVAYPNNGPFDRLTEPGDPALMDLSGRIDGYWFDCTNTHLVGGVEPNAEQRRYAKASQAACEAGMAALRPGARACDAYHAAEAAFARVNLPMAHYAGHQIGVTVNEFPRLVPYDDSVIEAGMVFCVEPGAYEGPGGRFGSRSEKMVLVTESGPEIMSRFDWGIA